MASLLANPIEQQSKALAVTSSVVVVVTPSVHVLIVVVQTPVYSFHVRSEKSSSGKQQAIWRLASCCAFPKKQQNTDATGSDNNITPS